MLHNSDTIHRCRNGKLTTITSKGKCFQEIYIHPIALQIYTYIYISTYIEGTRLRWDTCTISDDTRRQRKTIEEAKQSGEIQEKMRGKKT